MEEDTDGEYVRHEDYARLKEQIERMDTVMEGMRSFWNEDHEGLEKARARIAELENQLGITRMCVMCGKYKPAAEPRESPGCPPVDPEYGHLCGFDMTPQEAWAHWRQRAHDRRIESDRLRAELEALTTANAALRSVLTECADDLEAEVNARASARELPRRIERDLEPVRKARALLAQSNKEPTSE